MSNSLIVVPINQQGITDYETNIANRNNLAEFDLPENEINFLFD